jgi:hypothetical protein
LVARELAPVIDDLKAVFGVEVCYVDPGVGRFGLENALLPIGSQFLEVVAPIEEGTAGGRYLERRGGNGGYMFITQCDDHAPRRRRVEELGIRLAHHFERNAFQNMQLHPKDTGGTFFEIDCQTNGMEHDGPWTPAGPDWKPAQRLDVVSAIAAAEIQSPRHNELARRWGEIAEIDVQTGDDGWPFLQLENAVARFVEPTDGRPEGLGGLDLRVVDRDHVLRTAAERGCPVDGDTVLVCGTRFRLVD